MKNDLRIVFMGTPEFAVATLKAIVDQGYNVVGVITAPDKPAGRGRKMHQSAVKIYAESQNLKILQPTNLKDDAFVKALKDLDANIQVVVAFRMLPKVVWQMPDHGTFNLHASLLPQYRGAAPINWAIINGEKKTGVTTFFIDEKIDTGAMILQKKVKIKKKDNAGDLHDKLMQKGSKLVLKTIQLIEKGKVPTQIQPEEKKLKEAPKLNKQNCKIAWTDSLKDIYNKVRGLNPYPGSWTTLTNNNEESILKIYDCDKEKTSHHLDIGQIIIEDNELKVSVTGGYILVKELQLPGKRKMDSKSLLNGYKFSETAKVL